MSFYYIFSFQILNLFRTLSTLKTAIPAIYYYNITFSRPNVEKKCRTPEAVPAATMH